MLLPDHDGTIHGDLTADAMAARVRALCDRHAGIGGDGVLRVVRDGDGWFMDYRNADGSLSEMCGNGIRVFARHLVEEGLVSRGGPSGIGTRDGAKTLLDSRDDLVTVDLGVARVLGETKVSVGTASWPATHVDMGNPHAVAFVDDEADPGRPRPAPATRARRGGLPRRGQRRARRAARGAARGACASTSAARARPGRAAPAPAPCWSAVATADAAPRPATYRSTSPAAPSRSPGPRTTCPLTGPAVIVARGTTSL